MTGFIADLSPDKQLSCNLIGLGRLGSAFARVMSRHPMIKSLCLFSRHSRPGDNLNLLGPGVSMVSKLEDLAPADLTWLVVPDDQIVPLCQSLLLQQGIARQGIIVHCSGALGSGILSPCHDQGGFIASFHPLKAFAADTNQDSAFQGIDIVMEGDEAAINWLNPFAASLCAQPLVIRSQNKSLYHMGATMASNYLVTLAASALELLTEAGFEPTQARRLILNLMQGSLSNLAHSATLPQALTGPLSRGDSKTLALHLANCQNETIGDLYRAAALATIPLTQLSQEVLDEIKKILA